MKTRLIFLVLLIVCISCGTNNKPVSDAQKEKIKGDVKEVVNTFIKGCEELNFDVAVEPFFDSPDFVYIGNGKSHSYKELIAMKPLFDKYLSQKITIVDEKYAVLDNTTVLYTTNCTWLQNYKDGHAILDDPETFMFMFKKIDNKWRVIYWFDSWVEKNVPGESSKGLNQIELMKQMLGSWKGEIAKDTFYLAQYKPFGDGVEGTIKIVSKGKKIMEGRALLGYDKKLDKFIESDLVEGSDMMVYGIWYTAKDALTEVPLEYISNPANAPVIWKYELKPPDIFTWNNIENNKTTFSYTFHREKK
jgi:hypothetical protein